MKEYVEYVEKAFTGIKPGIGFLSSIISYLLFPDYAYQTSAMVLGVAIILDIVTKYMALSHEANGYRNAVRTRKIFSGTLFEKSKRKIILYLILAILAGLAYRVTPLAQFGIFFGTTMYAVLFLREAQSILENLDDAGYEVGWIINWAKKKEKEVLNEDNATNYLDKQYDNTRNDDSERI